jgi:hypothetical protein
MTFRRSEFYAPVATLFLALVALIGTSAALDQSTNSLEKSGRRFTDTHRAPSSSQVLLLAAKR